MLGDYSDHPGGYQKAMSLKSLDPQTAHAVVGRLIAERRRAGRPINFVGCLTECRRRLPAEGWKIPENLGQLIQERLARRQALTRRKISLPLDPHRGGEILLSAAMIRLAKSKRRVGGPGIRPERPLVGPETPGSPLTKEQMIAHWKAVLEKPSPLWGVLGAEKQGYAGHYYTQPPASLLPISKEYQELKAAAHAALYGGSVTLDSMTAFAEKLSAGPKASLDLETAFKPPDEK